MNDDLWHLPVTLTGKCVRLEPLRLNHINHLVEAGKDPAIWKFMMYGNLSIPDHMRQWVEGLLDLQAKGTDLPFVVVDKVSGEVIGATRFMEMRPSHRGLEIGGTWYGLEYQGTGVNLECKYLMLKYAFEVLNCIRVQFKVDSINGRSIRALEKLGSVKEGVLRNQFILPDGRVRDSIYFSILDREWGTIRSMLENELGFSSQK